MKKFLLGLFVVLTICLCGCDLLNQEEEEDYSKTDAPLKNNCIWVDSKLNTPSSERVKLSLDDDTLIKKYSGKHCTVYYSDKMNHKDANRKKIGELLTDKYFSELGEKFDSIYELETKILGSNVYPYENSYSPKRSTSQNLISRSSVNEKTYEIDDIDDVYIFNYNLTDNIIDEEDFDPVLKIGNESLNEHKKSNDIREINYLSVDHETVTKFQQNETDLLNSISEKVTYTNSRAAQDTTIFPETNSKIILVVMDINSDASDEQSSGVVGYFSQLDMISENIVRYFQDGSKYVGKVNESQILYLDSNYLLNSTGLVHSTIVHEFNHLLNFIQKNVKVNDYTGLDTSFTEMLAMVSEDLFSDYLGLKLNQTPKSRLADFSTYYWLGFSEWFKDEEHVYGSYANNFVYGAFLVRNYGGIELLNLLATNNYQSDKAITNALRKLGYSDTYEMTIKKFYKAVVNQRNYGNTLNKSSYFEDKLGFKAISLKDLTYRDSYGNTRNCLPNYLTPGEQYPIGPSGCVITKIDKEYLEDYGSSITIQNNNENITTEVLTYGEL